MTKSLDKFDKKKCDNIIANPEYETLFRLLDFAIIEASNRKLSMLAYILKIALLELEDLNESKKNQ